MAEPSLERDDYEPDPEDRGGDTPKKPGGLLSFLSELPVLILTAIVVAWLIKSFLVQPFYIPSSSMEPTLIGPGDRVLVSKLDYRFSEPDVGDIIVFKAPTFDDSSQPEDFIKRIVAVEGMEVQVKSGKVFVDGEKRREPFVRPDRSDSRFGPLTVPPDSVFVMGDNRANSKDSRVFGPVEESAIVGKAFFIYWPPTRAGILR